MKQLWLFPTLILLFSSLSLAAPFLGETFDTEAGWNFIDDNDYLNFTNGELQIRNLTKNAQADVYKDFGSGTIDTFNLVINFTADQTDEDLNFDYMLFSNIVESGASCLGNNSDCVFIRFTDRGSPNVNEFEILHINSTAVASVKGNGIFDLEDGVTHYILFNYTGEILQGALYADAALTTQEGTTLSLEGVTGAFRYMFVISGLNDGLMDGQINATISNIDDLLTQATPTIPTIISPIGSLGNGTHLLNATSTDAEGDPIQFRFFENATLIATTNTTDTRNYQTAGDFLIEVDAFDGTAFSFQNASTTITITITNSAPTIPVVTSPTGNTSGSGLNYQAVSTDADSDPIQYRFFLDDVLTVTTNTSSSFTTNPATYNLKVDAFDGTDYSANASSTFTVTHLGHNPTYTATDIPAAVIDFIGTYFVQFIAFAGLLALAIIFLMARRNSLRGF